MLKPTPTEKHQHSKILRTFDKTTYNAYKRMTSNNNTSRISTSTRAQTDYCPSAIRSHPKKLSYTAFIARKTQPQSMCPFGFTEKRFKWQNLLDKSNLVHPDDKRNRKRKVKRKSSLDGGFVDFFNKQKSEMEANKAYRFQKKNICILRANHSQEHSRNRNLMLYDSQRVIQPELNVSICVNVYRKKAI